MALYYLSDIINDGELGKRKKFKLPKPKIKLKLKGKGKLKKFALAPARASFLLLVKFNILGLAKKLAMGLQKNEAKVRNWWIKLGGDYSKLLKAINQGKNKKIIKRKMNDTLSDGELSFSVAGAISSATPIIVSVNKLFKALDIKLFSRKKKEVETEPEQEQEPEAEPEQDTEQGPQPEQEQEPEAEPEQDTEQERI